nr:hypothetical protein [Tanacetum cinerariifolium]
MDITHFLPPSAVTNFRRRKRGHHQESSRETRLLSETTATISTVVPKRYSRHRPNLSVRPEKYNNRRRTRIGSSLQDMKAPEYSFDLHQFVFFAITKRESSVPSADWRCKHRVPQRLTSTRPQRVFIRYQDSPESEHKFISIIDDDTFPQNKFALPCPFAFEQFDKLRFVGSSKGLFCFHGEYPEPGGLFPNTINQMAVIWNPSIKKSIAVHVPFTLDIYGVWKTPRGNLPRKSIQFRWDCVSLELDGMIYWNAYDRINNRGLGDYNLIMSFDMENEEFTEVNLPHDLANCSDLSISKLRGSLVVLQWCQVAGKPVYGMWMMDHGDLISFTKLFNINIPCASATSVLGFKKNGELILKKEIDDCDKLVDYCDKLATLEVYEPRSEHTNALGICGAHLSLSVSFYTETLILLDQSDGSIFCEKWWECD